MPGPRPQPTYLKLLCGSPGKKRRNANKSQAPIPPTPPEPPNFLSSQARDEWYRLAEGLHRLGLLALDVMPFAAYCTSVGRWMQCEEAQAVMAVRDPSGALTIGTASGCVSEHPLVRLAATSAHDVVRYAAEFGLSPSARSRVASPPRSRPHNSPACSPNGEDIPAIYDGGYAGRTA